MRIQSLITIIAAIVISACQAVKLPATDPSVPASAPIPIIATTTVSEGVNFEMAIPETVKAGDSTTFILRIKDSAGHPSSKSITSLSFASTDGSSYGVFDKVTQTAVGVYSVVYHGRRSGTSNTIHAVINGKTISALDGHIKVTHADPVGVVPVAGDAQTGVVATALPILAKFQVVDRYGNGVSGVTTQLNVTAGNGLIAGNAALIAVSDSDGFVQGPWILGQIIGSNILSATATLANGSSSPTTTLTALGVAGPVTQLIAVSGDNQQANHNAALALPIVIAAKDVFGNPVANQTIDWTIVTGGGTLYSDSAVTAANGQSTNQFTLGSAIGVQTAKATLRGKALNRVFTATSNKIAFSYTWLMNSANATQYSVGSNISFTANACQLTSFLQEDSSATGGFTNGTYNGIVLNTLSDTTTVGLKLGSVANCDGTLANCNPDDEFSSLWTPQYASLIGYWKLNAAPAAIAANAVLAANIGPSATAKNAGMNYVAGHLNQGIKFNGTNNYLDAGTPAAFQSLAQVTIAGWIKPTVVNNTQGLFGQELLYKMDLNGGTTAGTVRFLMGKGSAWNCTISSTLVVTANNWSHVVGTYNGTTAAIYINGMPAGTCAATGTSGTNANHFDMGSADLGTSPFSGTMDEVAVWNKGLTAAEVATLYARQATKYSGTFTSRVMDAASSQTWTSLSWITLLPFMKALPDAVSTTPQNETAASYPSLSGSMASIEALYHFDGSGTIPTGTTFADTSGKSRTATLSATASTSVSYGTGMFAQGIVTDGNGTLTAPMNSIFASDFSISFWAMPTSATSENVLIANGAYNANGFRMGTTGANPSWMFWSTESGGTTNVNYPATLNTWQHVVYTYSAASSASKLYVNGVLRSSSSGTLVAPAGTTFTIGSGMGWKYVGGLDELAIWSRTLDPKEPAQLYQRGASRIKFQVKTCASADCSDATFKGPDGTANTYFSELNNRNTQGVVSSGSQKVSPANLTLGSYTSPVASNRYFQYRAVLESDSATTTLMPELKSVMIGPAHYDASSPAIVGKTGVSYYNLSALVQTLGTTCADGVGYNLGIGSSFAAAVWYRWDATANSNAGGWVSTGNTAANSNDAATVVAHLASFPATTTTPSMVYLKAYLKSSGLNPCALTSVKLDGLN